MQTETEGGRFALGVVGPFGVDRLRADRAMETDYPVAIVGALLFRAERHAVIGCAIPYGRSLIALGEYAAERDCKTAPVGRRRLRRYSKPVDDVGNLTFAV